MSFSSNDDLEILPPPNNSKKRQEATCAKDNKPRLSFTGNSETDPVSLLDDDNNDDDRKCKAAPTTTADKKGISLKRELSSTNVTVRNKSKKTSSHQRKKAASVFSSDDDDDDDDLLETIQTTITRNTQKMKAHATTKETKKKPRRENPVVDAVHDKPTTGQTTKRNKQATTLEKQAAKQAAAAQKQRERQEARRAKQLQAQAEKQAKQHQRQVCQQAAGKLASTEIVVLLDAPVVLEEESAFLTCTQKSSGLEGASIQWIRKNALQGGAESAVAAFREGDATGYEHIPVLTMVVTGETFLGLLKHDGEDDYPRMEAWILKLQQDWKKVWKTTAEPRIILLLDRVQEALENQWKNSRSKSALATMEELQDALTWLLIQFRVENIPCKSDEELTGHVTKMTRLLAETPYVQETTEIACVKKIPSELKYDDSVATPEEQAQDCWLRQLQQIPSVSRQKALSFVAYYPTGVSLWRDYMDPTIDETSKRLLASTMFTDKRESRKLANQLYTVMTSQDPDQVL